MNKQLEEKNKDEPPNANIIQNLANQFSIPWSPDLYYSIRGAENVHVYLWVLKDLGWSLDNKILGLLFGTLAILWCIMLVFHASERRNTLEMFNILTISLWLFGNFIWMIGNLVYGIDGEFRFCASIVMCIGLFLWLAQRFWLLPSGFLKEDIYSINLYKNAKLFARKFDIFGVTVKLGDTWRNVEHLHTILWLLKDICWACEFKVLWIIFFTLTFILSVDFIWLSYKAPKMLIDTVHYVIQIIWLLANFTWALSELWLHSADTPKQLNDYSPNTGRWISAWLLVSTYFIVFLLYIVWLPLTAYGFIKNDYTKTNNDDVEITTNPIHNDAEITTNPIHNTI